jgi:hypothetical protein
VRPRRVVTGHDADGVAIVVSDEPVPRYVERRAIPGMTDAIVWATASPPRAPGDGADPTVAVSSVVPGPGETRFLTVTLPPASVMASARFDPAAAAAEDAEVIPGLAERFEPDNPGMHVTPTVDYVLVLEGEVWLDLDGGRETMLRAGDLVIQNATRHAWRNKSERPATMAVVMLGIAREGGGA